MTIHSVIRERGARRREKKGQRARVPVSDRRDAYLPRRNIRVFFICHGVKIRRDAESARERERDRERNGTLGGTRGKYESEADRRAPPHTRDASYGPPQGRPEKAIFL